MPTEAQATQSRGRVRRVLPGRVAQRLEVGRVDAPDPTDAQRRQLAAVDEAPHRLVLHRQDGGALVYGQVGAHGLHRLASGRPQSRHPSPPSTAAPFPEDRVGMDAYTTAWLGASAIVLACAGLGLVGAAVAEKDPSLGSLRGWRRLVALLLVEPFAAESELRRGAAGDASSPR
jgi:hypothetical protein